MSISYGGDYITDTDGGKLRPSSAIMRNRIINGAMVIDQRATAVTSTGYTVDRFQYQSSQASKGTTQQSSTAPTGFNKSLQFTSSSAYSVLSTDYFALQQVIEGYNIADLGWGTANAKTVTLSFQVYSSLTGTFGGSLINNGNNRSYPFSYSIPVANTWTTISITIAGDTTGTWLTTNGAGVKVWFSLGAGSTYSGTAGAWAGALYFQPTGATSVVGTSGATFYITGVQLEVGSSATGFEYRQYGQELALCQRYYEITGMVVYTSSDYRNGYFQVNKRATPTLTLTIASGSGASIAMSNPGSGELSNFFQTAGNSVTSGAKVIGSAEL